MKIHEFVISVTCIFFIIREFHHTLNTGKDSNDELSETVKLIQSNWNKDILYEA